MAKSKLNPKEVIELLKEVGASVNNKALSLFFASKGINISANSLRAHKAHASRK
jgi:hypothetical protein